MKSINRKFLIFSQIIVSLFLPLSFVFAQGTTSGACSSTMGNLGDVFNFLTCLLSRSIIPLIITLALVAFLFGVLQYVINADDAAKRTEGRKYMLWGIISLFVMLGIFGILQLIGNTFDIGTGGSISDITPHF